MKEPYDVSLSNWSLGLGSPVLRHPIRRPALRHADFEDKYDFSTVFYDCFWSADGKSLLLIGPPLQNLAEQLNLRFFAMPSGKELRAKVRERAFISLLVLPAPQALQCLRIESTAGTAFVVPQPNLSALFDGRRVLMTLSQNNEIEWIRDWVIYHQRLHGCDAALIYDNNSTRYDVSEINACLAGMEGVTGLALSWPYRYGPFDGRLPLTYDLWEGHFCQFGMLEHARYRFLASARCSLNLDIDELVVCPAGESICDLTEDSATGYLKFGGRWVEPYSELSDGGSAKPLHRHYRHVKTGRTQGCENKYTVVPRRVPDSAQFGVHDIFGHVDSELADDVELRHFKALNTNWTVDRPGTLKHRTAAGDTAEGLSLDNVLAGTLDRAFLGSPEALPEAPAVDRQSSIYRARSRASRLLRNGYVTQAEREVHKAIDQAPDWPSLRLQHAALLQQQGLAEAAQAARDDAQRLQEADGASHYDRGRYLLHTGDCAGAARLFHRACQTEPGFAAAYAALGRLYRSSGRSRAAEHIVRRGLGRAPSSALLHTLLAELLAAKGQNEAALQHVNKAIEIEPRNARLLLFRSRLLRTLDRARDAFTTTRGARKLLSDPSLTIGQLAAAIDNPFAFTFPDGDDMMARIEQISCLLQLGKLKDADQQSQDLLAAFPNRPHAHEARYYALDVLGRHDEAQVQLTQAIRHARRDLARLPPQTLGRYGEREWHDTRLAHLHHLLLCAGRTEEANSLLEGELQLNPENYRLTLQFIYVLAAEARRTELKQFIAAGLKRFPRDPQMWNEQGRILEAEGNSDAAIEAYRRAIRLGSRQAWQISHLAHLLIERSNQHPEELAEAEDLLRQALSLDHKHALSHYRIGEVLWRQGHRAEALSAWRLAAGLAPQEAWLWSHLGGHLVDCEELSEAETALMKAHCLVPDDMLTHYRLGRLSEANGDLETAIACIGKALDLKPDVGWAWQHLGNLLKRVGRLEEAERAYERAKATG